MFMMATKNTVKTRFIALARNIKVKLSTVSKRFPETMLMCLLTTATLMVLNNDLIDDRQMVTRLAMVLALGVPLSLCVRLFFERAPAAKKWIKALVYLASATGLLLYYLVLLEDFGMVSISRYIAVTFALYLAFAVIPHFYRKEDFELYVIKLFISFLITYLYAVILYLGLAAILATISYLFSVNISSRFYIDLLLLVAGLLGPAFFLAEMPAISKEIYLESYPGVLNVLLSYILLPLILAYSLILYAYFIRVALTAQWPDVMVSHLVLWYAIASLLVIFCISPLRIVNLWLKSFIAYFPKLILPLLVMMFVAMGIRVNAYGITENRYFVIAAGLWVTGSMLYFFFNKKQRTIFIPFSLALLAVLSVFGPWSSYSVSVRSQNQRFEKILISRGLVHDGRIVAPSADIPSIERREISSIILYFGRYHELDKLRLLPEDFTINQMEDLFGFPLHDEYHYDPYNMVHFNYSLENMEAVWNISGYDYFREISPRRPALPGGGFKGDHQIDISYSSQDHTLQISLAGEVIYRRDITGLLSKVHRGNEGKNAVENEKMVFSERKEGLELLYIFNRVSGFENKSTGEITFEPPGIFLFLRVESQEIF